MSGPRTLSDADIDRLEYDLPLRVTELRIGPQTEAAIEAAEAGETVSVDASAGPMPALGLVPSTASDPVR